MTLISYAAALRKVEAGEITMHDLEDLRKRGLVGPSPIEERIALFPSEEIPLVHELFERVRHFNEHTASYHRLRIQVLKHQPYHEGEDQ